MAFAVVRVRGGITAVQGVNETLQFMHLNRINHCTVIPQNPSYKGMLQKSKDYITWGEITPETLARLILMNGKLEGGDKLTDAYVKANSKFSSVLAMAKAICNDEFAYKDLKGVSPLFRLPPPRKGYEGIKRQYNPKHPNRGGTLGYRGDAINDLIGKMLPQPAKASKKADKAEDKNKSSKQSKPSKPAKPEEKPKGKKPEGKAPAKKAPAKKAGKPNNSGKSVEKKSGKKSKSKEE